METILRKNFYSRSPVRVARDLIGKLLVRKLNEDTRLDGIIVETEAYGGACDPASHAYRGMTKRNEGMFGESGYAYIYFTYGFHHCLNFVTGTKGTASAVLIRALDPRSGLETMQALRKKTAANDIASGPGKLCQALSIDLKLNGIDITSSSSPIYVVDIKEKPVVKVSSRIGVSSGSDRKWRFYVLDNPNVSKHRPS